jgi:hypothetical protein
MREYASFQKKCTKSCALMRDDVKAERIRIIDRAVSAYERGLITVDEAMQMIAKP